MRNKATLLRSVSAIATAAASAGGAHQALAQDSSTDGYYYSVQGGLLFSPSEEYLTQLEDKLGGWETGYSGSSFYSAYYSSYSSGFDDMKGFNGSVAFGKQLDPNWDVRGVATANHLGSTSGYFSSFSVYSGFTMYSGGGLRTSRGIEYFAQGGVYSFGFETLDLEIGYSPVLTDDFNIRLFGGVRALHFKDTFEGWNSGFAAGSSYYSGFDGTFSGFSGFQANYFEGSTTSEFFGVGPRVGLDVSKRFEGTNFGISGTVSGALLFGKQKTTTSGWSEYFAYYSSFWGSGGSGNSSAGVFSGSGYFSSSYEVDKKVIDLQGKIGLDYYLDDANKLTVGLQGEKLFNVGPDDDSDVTRTTGGVFVGLSGTF